MKLTVLERVVLLSILPKEGDFTTIKIVRELRESLSFTEKEHVLLQFKTKDNALHWNPDNEMIADIAIGNKAHTIIENVLVEMNKEKKITDEVFSLYEKFIGDK